MEETKTIPKNEIEKKLLSAIKRLFDNESFLLENRANERSVSHKLAEYLQILFPEYHVDCEYNLKGLDIKILEGIHKCSKQKKTDRIYPDIIVHHRNTDANNLLVIEIKTRKIQKNDSDFICDARKLEKFTSNDGQYKYQFGILIKFKGLKEPEIIWYSKGKRVTFINLK